MPSANNRRVTRPLRPNNKMAAMAMENGGEMVGMRAATWTRRFKWYAAAHVTVSEDEAKCGPQERAQGAHLYGIGEDEAIMAAIGGVDCTA